MTPSILKLMKARGKTHKADAQRLSPCAAHASADRSANNRSATDFLLVRDPREASSVNGSPRSRVIRLSPEAAPTSGASPIAPLPAPDIFRRRPFSVRGIGALLQPLSSFGECIALVIAALLAIPSYVIISAVRLWQKKVRHVSL